VVSGIGWFVARRSDDKVTRKGPLVPLFLIGFAALVAINSIGYLPKLAIDVATESSRWCLVTAIAALGMKTSFKSLIEVGWRPIALMLVESAWIAALVLLSVVFFI